MMKIQSTLSVLLLASSTIGFAQSPTDTTAAYAQRGNRLMILGAKAEKAVNGKQVVFNQIIELNTGKSQPLPSLPNTPDVPSMTAARQITQAAWMNDDAAAVFMRIMNSQNMPETEWLGTLNVKSNKYTPLPALPRTQDPQSGQDTAPKLIGATSEHAYIVAEDGLFIRVHVKSGGQTTLSKLLRKRADIAGRVLSDGRVVVAGGMVESEMVLTRERGCGAPATAPCVEKYTGFGQRLPSRRHEMYDPIANTWRNSAPSRASGGSAAILPSGRVAKVGDFTTSTVDPNDAKLKTDRTTALLEISAEDGQSWRRITLPKPLAELFSSAGIAVVTVAEANGLLDRGLFLRTTAGGSTTPNSGLGSPQKPVWWWLADVDDVKASWQIVSTDGNLNTATQKINTEKTALHVRPSAESAAVYVK